MNTAKNQENWPYHPYDGNDPKKQGSYVKCKSNPCSLHGGSDIIASSPEEAYAKAHTTDGWGFAPSSTDNVSIVNSASNEPSNKITEDADWFFDELDKKDSHKVSLKSNKNTASPDASKKNTGKNASNAYKYTEPDAKSRSKDWRLTHRYKTQEQHDYIVNRDERLKAEGLYVYDSPLFHKMPANKTTAELARELYPDCKHADDADIQKDLAMRTEDIYATELDDKEKNSLYDYTDEYYEVVNSVLRDTADADDYGYDSYYVDDTISNMSTAMSKSDVLRHDTVFYRRRFMPEGDFGSRGGEEKSYYHAVADAMNADNVDNAVISRSNFLSTSTQDILCNSKTHAEPQYIIKAPAGTRGLLMVNGAHPEEHEFLIDKGYDYRIAGIYEPGKLKESNSKMVFDKCPVIVLEVIPDKE